MVKYKIGITEAGDAGIDLSWVQKLDSVDGAIVITKSLTPVFRERVLTSEKKLIVHATCTGYGGSILEPNVPTARDQMAALIQLVQDGFPKERVVVRVDPIIPTEKGLGKALYIIEAAMDAGFARFRVSVIDMYPHVRGRFEKAGLPVPYKGGFYPDKESLRAVDAMLAEAGEYWSNQGRSSADLQIECCAEPGLRIPIHAGCISAYDLALLGLDPSESDTLGTQRKGCMCYSGKTELLSHRTQCPHKCLYCYWR